MLFFVCRSVISRSSLGCRSVMGFGSPQAYSLNNRTFRIGLLYPCYTLAFLLLYPCVSPGHTKPTTKLQKRTHTRKAYAHIFTKCKEIGAKIYELQSLVLHSVGDMPVSRAKEREKTAGEEKPQAEAMSAIFICGCSVMSRCASSTLYRLTSW